MLNFLSYLRHSENKQKFSVGRTIIGKYSCLWDPKFVFTWCTQLPKATVQDLAFSLSYVRCGAQAVYYANFFVQVDFLPNRLRRVINSFNARCYNANVLCGYLYRF
jgi:hypothetical protein